MCRSVTDSFKGRCGAAAAFFTPPRRIRSGMEIKMRKAGVQEIQKFLDEYVECIRRNGDEMLGQSMPELLEEKFALYETTGNRLIYEEDYFRRRKFLAVFGCLAILDGKKEYLDKLCQVMLGICEEECWALPAHVNRSREPHWRVKVDLFASETAHALSEIMHLLGEKLPEQVRETVHKNVMERVLEPVIEAPIPYQPWERSGHNWNAVCSGSVGCAAIYQMQGEPERLEALLCRLAESLPCYIDGFGEDGACMEGLAYFSYGFVYYAGFAQVLGRYVEERIRSEGRTALPEALLNAADLLSSEKCRKIAMFQQCCYFPSGRTLSFSDGESRDHYRMGLTCFLARRYPEVELPPVSCASGFEGDSCYRFMACLRDVLWTKQYLESLETKAPESADTAQAEEAPACIVLPYAQWCICRGRSGGGMACKGGHNEEPHNHNDVGSFLYLLGDEMLLCDLGCGEYTRQYFSEERYTILCNSSLGHSVPILGGREQKEGRRYGCSSFEADGEGNVRVEFAGAYESSAAHSLVRQLAYDPAAETLEVEDVLTLTEDGLSMRENLVTQYEPKVQDGVILLRGARHACRILVPEGSGELQVEARNHSNHQGQPETVYCISWEVPMTGEGVRGCRFRVEPVQV